LKYSKDKMTKKLDYTKPPSIRVKVPNYNNKWSLEIYDTKGNMIFPCDNENMTPMDFVPKKSNVACVIQCGGLWITPKAFGVTWKVNQIVVKPNEVQSVFGKCHVQLSTEEITALENTVVQDEAVNEEEETVPAGVKTEVQDSDGEEDLATESVSEPVVEKVSEPVPVPVVAPKKVVKKAPAVVEQEEQAPAPVVKKVVKKKVVA
jgi:hypothetical protein